MNIWFDADNGPHVLIMRPLAEELRRRGHRVRFTARDRTSTCQLLDLYGLSYTKVGSEFGTSMLAKATGTLRRAAALVGAARSWNADVSFGHGSRALPVASRLLGVPSVTMYDYEWVDPRLFAWLCRTILLPDAIDDPRCRDAGIPVGKAHRYSGLKEHLYLDGRPLEPDPIRRDLDLDPDVTHVLLRPPATNAHYHNPEAERLLDAILRRIADAEDVRIIYLARSEDQLALLGDFPRDRVKIPQRVYDGPSLVAVADLMISGGGTMTREAAVLGVPSYSFFRGRLGRVDECLENDERLFMLRCKEDVDRKLRLVKRTRPLVAPDSGPLVAAVCDAIEAAAR